jgi:hypothetical protein
MAPAVRFSRSSKTLRSGSKMKSFIIQTKAAKSTK